MGNWTCQLSNGYRKPWTRGPGWELPIRPSPIYPGGKATLTHHINRVGATQLAHIVPAPASGPNQVLSNYVIKVRLPYINKRHFIAWRRRRQWPPASRIFVGDTDADTPSPASAGVGGPVLPCSSKNSPVTIICNHYYSTVTGWRWHTLRWWLCGDGAGGDRIR